MSLINVNTIILVSKIDWGTVADWVSGIGSLIAIAFAYWQIAEQRKEYEEEKKEKTSREILANRPFFSFMPISYLKSEKDHLWIINEDLKSEILNNLFEKTWKGYVFFKNTIVAYKFKNVSQAVATNVVLKIEYQNKVKDRILKTDYCNIETCVIGNEEVIMLPHSIMNEPSIYINCFKRVSLYFTTVDDRTYRQRWIEKVDKSGALCIKQVDVKEISIEEMPNKGASIRLDV